MNKTLLDDLNYIFKKFNKKKIFHNKTILITGYNGFIGFELSQFFITFIKELNIKKIYLTDIKTKNKIFKSKIFYKNHNIVKEKIEKISSKKIDIIIHAASIASPVLYRKKPLETFQSNINGLNNVLDYAKKNKIFRVLYFSSSEIYGSPPKKEIPTSEKYYGNVPTIGPRACYDEAKRACETLCYIYNNKYNVNVRIVRPFNNYGPGMKLDDGRLPADLAKSIIDNKDIKIFSSGSPSRTFCYISDAIVGYLKVLAYKKFDVFNIGNDDEQVSVQNFAKLFKNVATKNKLIKKKIKITYLKNNDKNYLKHNPERRRPNIQKAKYLLNFNPEIKLKNGIEKYLNFLTLR